jgi:hypothetical protein
MMTATLSTRNTSNIGTNNDRAFNFLVPVITLKSVTIKLCFEGKVDQGLEQPGKANKQEAYLKNHSQ